MLAPILEARLDDLLAAWRHHNDLSRQGAPLIDLAAARWKLETLRVATQRLRRGFHPEERELADALGTTYCVSFDETVFLFATDADWDIEGRFTCLCGTAIEVSATPSV